MASLRLDGAATQWYFQLERNFGIISWLHFVEHANLQFETPIRSNALVKSRTCSARALSRSTSVNSLLSCVTTTI
jgi:hypothetical protein